MNNEIKNILDRLERIDHKEYSCDFEFADSATFDEVARCFEERKVFANYITNLQQEINKLTAESTEWESKCYDLQQENERLKEYYDLMVQFNQKNLDRFCDYKTRCEKAIEYIMTELIDEWSIRNRGYVSGSDLPVDAITPLLNILQNGSDTSE